jgi:hypothetical protein
MPKYLRGFNVMINKHPLFITVLYLLITGFHVAASWNQYAPRVTPDEESYLTQAQYFAGEYTFSNTKSDLSQENDFTSSDTSPFDIPYYHFGYSLLVSPIYWLTDTPTAAYKGIMVFNSFMLSSLFLILFYWIRMVRDINFYIAAAIALIVSLYPPYVLQASIGWAENALIPGFALSCLLFTRHLKVGSITTVTLFALISGFQYTIHPRGAAVAIAAIICLICLALVRKDKWQLSTIGVVLILGIIITTKMKANEMAIMMNVVPHSGRIVENLISIFTSELITVLLGNLLYLTLASLGLFLLGITESVKQVIYKNTKNLKALVSDIHTGSLIYIFIASFLTFCIGITFLARKEEWHNSNQLLDIFLYGRYNEVYLSIYITLGLLWIYCSNERGIQQYRKQLTIGFWLVVAAGITCAFLLSDFTYMRTIHSFSLFPWFVISLVFSEWTGNSLVFFIPLLWTWLVLQLFFQSKLKGFLTVGVYFFLLDVFMITYITPNLKLPAG